MSDQTTPGGSTVTVPTSVLDDLVGEGKKFRTVEDLAQGKLNSDTFILKLQSENKELRDLVTQLGTKQDEDRRRLDFLSRVAEGNTAVQPGTPPATAQPQQATPPAPAGLTDEQVINLLKREKQADREAANKAAVDAVLIKQFGADAKAFLEQKAQKLGVDLQFLVDQAKANPNVFFQLVNVDPQAQRSNASLTSSQSGGPSQVPGGPAAVRNKAYYEGLMKQEGAWKFASNKDLQIQMHKDMLALGDQWDA